MPAAITAAATWLSSTVAISVATATFLVNTGLTVLLSVVSSKLFAPKLPKAGMSGLQVMTRSAIEYRKIVYGKSLISGPIVYNNISGTNGEYLWYVIALCDGESESIDAIWLDSEKIDGADIEFPGGASTGEVTASRWVGASSTKAIVFHWWLGNDNQVVDTLLDSSFAQIDSNFRLRGITYLVARFLYNANTEKVWEGGPPNAIKAEVKGRKVFDPRQYALNADPTFQTIARPVGQQLKWFSDSTQTTAIDAGWTRLSNNVLRLTDNNNDENMLFSERIPVDTTKTYTVKVRAKQSSGDRVNSLGVAFYNSAGAIIQDGSVDYHYFLVDYVFQSGSHLTYTDSYGDSGSRNIPAGAVSMAFVGSFVGSGTTSSTVEIIDPVIYEGQSQQTFESKTTWDWSDNPALCVADYLTQIMGVSYDRIDWPYFIEAANDCDVLVDIPTSSTEKRFTCNGALSLGDTHKNNLESLISSCDGRLSYSGKWRLRASVWREPDITIDEDDLADDVEIRGSAPKSERANVIRGYFVDPSRDYQAVEFPQISSVAYLARDNGKVITNDLDLPMTNSVTMAQRIAFRLLEQSDNQTVVSLNVNMMGLQVSVGDVVNLDLPTLGWTNGGNLLPYSEDFTSWTITGGSGAVIDVPELDRPTLDLPELDVPHSSGGGTISLNDDLSPSATSYANKIELTTSSSASFSYEVLNAGSASGNVFSLYVKRGVGANRFLLENSETSTNLVSISIDYDTGEVTYYGTQYGHAYVEHAQHGWLRVVLVANGQQIIDDDKLTVYAGFDGTAAINGDYFYMYAAQLVAGQELLPYKKTTGTAITTSVKTFRVIEWEMNADSSFKLTLRQDDEGDYTDPLESEYASEATGGIAVPSLVVAPPSNLTAAAIKGGVLLDWDDPPSRLYDHIEIWASDDNDRDNAELIATVPKSPFTDNITTMLRRRYYWVRARNFEDALSIWEPNSTTTTASSYPLVQQDAMVADPWIRQGASYWDLSDSNASYLADGGLAGETDAVIMSTDSSFGADFFTAARRGPREYDVMASGTMNIEIRYRVSLATQPGGTWTTGIRPVVVVEDENGSNANTYTGANSERITFDNTSTVDVWVDGTTVIEIDESAETPPRFIRVGMGVSKNAFGPDFAVDFLDAKILGNAFAGQGKPGMVPDPGTASGKFLRDDGTWQTP